MKKQILKVSNIIKYYGNRRNITKAINDISFDVYEGEFIGIMGASGSGKTTLLNCISSIDEVTGGSIIINDDEITKMNVKRLARFRRDELGFIFQESNLLDTLTGYENIALTLTISKVKYEEIDKRIKSISDKLNITDVLSKYPYEMSGGEKQRIACARAIVKKPTLILADEPTGALDSKSAKMFLESITDLNKQLDATIIMVTHDPFTASYADRILFIKDGKIFNEIIKGSDNRKNFFNKIIDVVTLLGGDARDVF